MPIRNQDDVLSRTKMLEDQYYKKQDTQSSKNFDRFIYMAPGNKDKFYDWRMDFSKKNFNSSTFLIGEERFVNRPDAISYEVYGNAKYWWIIAMANNIKDPFFEFYKGRKLSIPDIDIFKRELGV